MTIFVIESNSNTSLEIVKATVTLLVENTDMKHLPKRKVLVIEGDFPGPDSTYTLHEEKLKHKHVGVNMMYAFGPSDEKLVDK